MKKNYSSTLSLALVAVADALAAMEDKKLTASELIKLAMDLTMILGVQAAQKDITLKMKPNGGASLNFSPAIMNKLQFKV